MSAIELIRSVTTANNYFPTTVQWVSDALDQDASMPEIESRAKDILGQLEKHNPRTDKTRYHFGQPATDREKLLKLVFELSFRAQPDAITAAAEAIHPDQAVFYPTWKKVCWIQIPKLAANVLNHPLFKIALTVAAIYYSYQACYAAYEATVAFTARSIPFIINNTPVVIFRAGNAVLDLKDWAYRNMWKILFYTWATQQVILIGPEIPHVTPVARSFSIWSALNIVYSSPQTIFSFAITKAWETATFTWSNCTELANSIKGRVDEANDARLATCRAKALDVWQTIMIEQAPQY